MRIGELSKDTGIPVPTIKYYLREGLLPAGERTHANQVSYTAEHARRLRLIRAMVQVGDLPIGTVRTMLAEIDSAERPTDSMLGRLSGALVAPRSHGPHADEDELAETAALLRRHGYTRTDSVHVQMIADVLAMLRRLGRPELAAIVDDYADLALRMAETDLATLTALEDRDNLAESMIIGSVLGEALFAALRRAAHATVSGRVFPEDKFDTSPPS
ncbi:MerR family transcriptional regulator [Actinocatenispora sera]|uniref:MerR family transcriptional regulator n=1 Tax=Actinocatenispora sera TaxID=390989 RepID=UPI0033C79B12